MPLALYSLVALVREFLLHMIEQRGGAILLATGASAVQDRGRPGGRQANPGTRSGRRP